MSNIHISAAYWHICKFACSETPAEAYGRTLLMSANDLSLLLDINKSSEKVIREKAITVVSSMQSQNRLDFMNSRVNLPWPILHQSV